VALQVPALAKLPFALPFWALSFPLAAITTASFRYADLAQSDAHRLLGMGLLALLVLTIAGLSLRTIQAALAGEICQPEG
jgi:tellurite resistance protein